MWKYEKRLQYPVNISQPNPKLAQFIISQYGGPDGEMGASMRYLSQRFAMPYKAAKGALTDIGTEESVHFLYTYKCPGNQPGHISVQILLNLLCRALKVILLVSFVIAAVFVNIL